MDKLQQQGLILMDDNQEDYDPSEQEILEYAEFLGFDFQEDQDLLWIAKQGLKAPLPEGWKACQTQNEEIQYYNLETQDIQWNHPLDEFYKNLYQQEKQKKLKNKGESGQVIQEVIDGEESDRNQNSMNNLNRKNNFKDVDMQQSQIQKVNQEKKEDIEQQYQETQHSQQNEDYDQIKFDNQTQFQIENKNQNTYENQVQNQNQDQQQNKKYIQISANNGSGIKVLNPQDKFQHRGISPQRLIDQQQKPQFIQGEDQNLKNSQKQVENCKNNLSQKVAVDLDQWGVQNLDLNQDNFINENQSLVKKKDKNQQKSPGQLCRQEYMVNSNKNSEFFENFENQEADLQNLIGNDAELMAYYENLKREFAQTNFRNYYNNNRNDQDQLDLWLEEVKQQQNEELDEFQREFQKEKDHEYEQYKRQLQQKNKEKLEQIKNESFQSLTYQNQSMQYQSENKNLNNLIIDNNLNDEENSLDFSVVTPYDNFQIQDTKEEHQKALEQMKKDYLLQKQDIEEKEKQAYEEEKLEIDVEIRDSIQQIQEQLEVELEIELESSKLDFENENEILEVLGKENYGIFQQFQEEQKFKSKEILEKRMEEIKKQIEDNYRGILQKEQEEFDVTMKEMEQKDKDIEIANQESFEKQILRYKEKLRQKFEQESSEENKKLEVQFQQINQEMEILKQQFKEACGYKQNEQGENLGKQSKKEEEEKQEEEEEEVQKKREFNNLQDFNDCLQEKKLELQQMEQIINDMNQQNMKLQLELEKFKEEQQILKTQFGNQQAEKCNTEVQKQQRIKEIERILEGNEKLEQELRKKKEESELVLNNLNLKLVYIKEQNKMINEKILKEKNIDQNQNQNQNQNQKQDMNIHQNNNNTFESNQENFELDNSINENKDLIEIQKENVKEEQNVRKQFPKFSWNFKNVFKKQQNQGYNNGNYDSEQLKSLIQKFKSEKLDLIEKKQQIEQNQLAKQQEKKDQNEEKEEQNQNQDDFQQELNQIDYEINVVSSKIMELSKQLRNFDQREKKDSQNKKTNGLEGFTQVK
ncbi:WW domain [Pseudocohnilembus persalinus]|uniref:WW domain n=1 Tax=Pseudocohnilembus persalinus TaxID=266149 RepID=A0A0V0QCY4_PSEPJ|nr:WW domain [Pseudocohnilembus persalinus]|eukprot:KRX00083.1 WW domain [Pseudocohnilembus persalinus]